MAWHGSNDFAEKAPTAPVTKSPRPLSEVREYARLALVVSLIHNLNQPPVFLVYNTQASGYSEEDAEIVTDVLMYAELRGNNQGELFF